MNTGRLPFWQFFHAIEKELSYERWISKYKLLLEAFDSGVIANDDDWQGLRRFLRVVYLQHYGDLARFNELLEAAVDQEQVFLEEYALAVMALDKPKETNADKPADRPDTTTKAPPKPDAQAAKARELSRGQTGDFMEEPLDAHLPKKYYYEPPVDVDKNNHRPVERVRNSGEGTHFLMTDEYFAVTRRQMVKGWQFLRYQEAGRASGDIDFPATVNRIAKEGLFTTPVYTPGLKNRDDALIIFADCRGSMMPFHELTERLINTAKSEGGHPKAPVYYFQNYPSGYVYGKPNFADPVKLSEALVRANSSSTVAVIISDGGAAKGKLNKRREEMIGVFLEMLARTCAHVIWLNPMPENRWKGTTAGAIAQNKNVKMKSVMDDHTYTFQDMVRNILRHTKE